MSENKRKNIIASLLWLAIWQAAAAAVGNGLLLPGPAGTVRALAGLAVTGEFYLNMGWTFFRCILAMVLSFGAGALCAGAACRWPAAKSILSLPVAFFKAVPVMALVIYVILLADSDWVAVIVCFFMCFPIVYANILAGLESMPEEYLELTRIYGLGRWQRIRLIYVPGILPHIRSAVSLIAGISWKAVVAAEVLSIPKYSLGYEMLNAKYYLETANLFAYIVTIVALSLAFEKLIKAAMNRIEWHGYEGSKVERGRSVNDTSLSAPEVSCHSLSKSFGGKLVLDDVNVTFGEGKVTAVMGPSGEGKTTLARIIAGLETADGGQVEFSDEAVVSFLFQEDRLLPWLNIYDNIVLSVGGAECSARVRTLAERLEISDTLWQLPAALSGGMRHRAALARTFLAECNLLILDEPFRGLDDALKERIVNKLWEIETAGKTVILITHNQDDVEKLGDVVAKLQ
ncbi:MAG: ATP-binding cassette domain-containing protein [Firmicutes bacterium]|nr:ATP-binding cassette domain-containing protein [Bacillota bacterium]